MRNAPTPIHPGTIVLVTRYHPAHGWDATALVIDTRHYDHGTCEYLLRYPGDHPDRWTPSHDVLHHANSIHDL